MIKSIFLITILLSTINARIGFTHFALDYIRAASAKVHKSVDESRGNNYADNKSPSYSSGGHQDQHILDSVFKNSNCDQLINKGIYTICYSYKYKSALGGWTTLYGDRVSEVNIKKRPRFYNEKTIPMRYRTKYSDYTHSGYDRGHTVMADADADYSEKSLRKTYSMANITMQAPMVNRKTWIKVEKYGRYIARKLGEVKSVTLVEYTNYKIKGIGVPSGYYRIYYNNKANFQRCFYYRNDLNVRWKQDKLKSHLIDCSSILN